MTSTEVQHPTLAVILPALEAALDTVLSDGWWFNEFDYKAMPNGSGEITLTEDTLSFEPACVQAALRGVRLFNPSTMSYVWEGPVEGTLTTRVPFEELPESAARAVRDHALIMAEVQDLGMVDDVRMYLTLAEQSQAKLLGEHLRQRKYSTRGSRRFQRLQHAMRSY